MKMITRRGFVGGVAVLPVLRFTAADAQISASAAEARAIAKDAYVYGFPIVDNYRIQHAYWVDKATPEYKAPWNQIWNSARLYTPADTAIQTPNSDTLYSFIGADLRSEPLVLTVPAMEKERYFSVQLIDPSDIENVKKVQAGYKVQPLSAFLGQPAPKAAPAIDFIKPLTPAEEKTSLRFFNILNFVLQFCP